MSIEALPMVSAKTLLDQLDEVLAAHTDRSPEFVEQLRALAQQQAVPEQRRRALWGIYSILKAHTARDTVWVEAAQALRRALRKE